jgi:hypothetical protein
VLPMLVMEASRAARASAIWRAVSGELRGGEGWVFEEEVEGRVGEMEGGAGAVMGALEEEASADMVGGSIVLRVRLANSYGALRV